MRINRRLTVWVLVLVITGLGTLCRIAVAQTLLEGLAADTARVLTYRFTIAGQDIGSIVCRFEKEPNSGGPGAAYTIKSRLDLDFQRINIQKSVVASSQGAIDAAGRLHTYRLDMAANAQKVVIDCEFDGRRIEETLQVGKNTYRKKLAINQHPTYILDNNMIGMWALMVHQLDVEGNSNLKVYGFFPQSLQVMPLELRFVKRERLKIGTAEHNTSVYAVDAIKEMFWITDSGILAKIEAPLQKLRIGPVIMETINK
jgi:hypothetical protein